MNLELITESFLNQKLGLGINLAYYENGVWTEYSKGQIDDRNIETSPSAYYDIASLTKTFTAVQILLLIQENMLELDIQAGETLDFLKEFDVTIKDLLCHHSGLRHIIPVEKNKDYSINEINSILFEAKNLTQDLSFKTLYTDLGHVYLGKIIEKITGLSLQKNLDIFLKKFNLPGITYSPENKLIAKSEIDLEPGICMDEKARFMSGVAGHAGIFASLKGLQEYCLAWLENRFNLDIHLWLQAWNAQNSVLGLRSENYGLVWRLGYLSKLVNHSGYTGPCIFLDFEKQRALVYTCNWTFPKRNLENRQKFIQFSQGIGRVFEE